MDPVTVSAQFAAFIWASRSNPKIEPGQERAVRFARKNWNAFLPLAHEGLGRLLLKIAAAPEKGLYRGPSRRRLARARRLRLRRRSVVN
jgi:hypothetical protein